MTFTSYIQFTNLDYPTILLFIMFIIIAIAWGYTIEYDNNNNHN